MNERKDQNDREESRFAEMFSAAKGNAPQPDRAFLQRLKEQSTQTLQKNLAGAPPQPADKRKRTMKLLKRLAPVAVAACVVIAVAAVVTFLTSGNGGATVAWADVQEMIRNVETLTYKQTTTMEGDFPEGVPAEMTATMMFMEPGRMRMEIAIGSHKAISIMDMQQKKMISLDEAQKMATVFDLSSMPEESKEQDYLAEIKKLIEESETELGERTIDGRLAQGYRVEKGGNYVMTLWVDAQTCEPIEMELTLFKGEAVTTMYDFVFNAELDESLFSVEVPEGYTIREQTIDIKPTSSEDMVGMFRIWTKVRGGTFPDELTPVHLAKDFKALETNNSAESAAALKDEFKEDDSLKMAIVIGKGISLIALHEEARYVGKGVKLGDAETAVFWYRPKDSETYKVIYGDLRVEDVAEEDLPKR